MKKKLVIDLKKLMDVNTPIIYIHDFDFARIDSVIKEAVGTAKVLEWNPAAGFVNFLNKDSMTPNEFQPLVTFLENRYHERCASERYIVLKEIQSELEDSRVRSLLQQMSQKRLYDTSCSTSIIIESSVNRIPDELSMYVSFLDVPYPSETEIDELIDHHVSVNGYQSEFTDHSRREIKKYLRGMSSFDIDRVLDMAMSLNGTLEPKDADMILKQKKQMVKRSGTVECIDAKETLDDIGGLDFLKKYLQQKAEVFMDGDAIEYGVRKPKGIFLVGMPGCGKSLCAKAAGNIFNAPILKLDMGSLMGKYVGESEENMRKSIKIAEAAAPCILWIDEIEKAFSGVGGPNDVLTRMFGYFLTWLQDKTSDVYVIATANKAKDLPPELMRKGRFDEIFCVDLPNESERESIFKAHLKKLNGRPCLPDIKALDSGYSRLVEVTDGFNGADIESAIYQAVEDRYLQNPGMPIDTTSLEIACRNTLDISKSCADQIREMKMIFSKSSFRSATTGLLIEAKEENPQASQP